MLSLSKNKKYGLICEVTKIMKLFFRFIISKWKNIFPYILLNILREFLLKKSVKESLAMIVFDHSRTSYKTRQQRDVVLIDC